MVYLKISSPHARELTVVSGGSDIGVIDRNGLHAYVPWGTRALSIRRYDPQNTEIGTFGLIMARVDSIYTLED